MAPKQVLVNNLLYDASQVGIPADHVDDEYLVAPRKWDIDNIKRFMLFIGPMSSIFDYATFFLMLYFFKCQAPHLPVPPELAARFANPETVENTYAAALFHTGWFVESILTQTLIVHIIRTRKIPFLQSRPSAILLGTTLLIMLIGGTLPYMPFASYFGFVPLPPIYWAWIAGFLLTYSILTHYVKVWFHNKYGID